MSIGINNPRYVMTAEDRVGYYRWARELEGKLKKQGELKHSDEPGLPPSDRGAFQPAQRRPVWRTSSGKFRSAAGST